MSAGAADCTIPYPMTQAARKPPTSLKVHPRLAERNTGTPTTNQMSRDPNKKKRAAESKLMSRLLDRRPLSLLLVFALPISAGRDSTDPRSTSKSTPAMVQSERLKPRVVSKRPPRKKPTPFSAFFEPVRTATHLNSAEPSLSGAMSLMVLFALILVRSLAMPDSDCAAITYATDISRDQLGLTADSIASATI